MSDHVEIAIAFCHECIGWQDAYRDPDGAAIILRPGLQEIGEEFCYDDREDVSAAVEAWCYVEKLDYMLSYESGLGMFEMIVLCNDSRMYSGRYDSGYFQTACEAMLQGCVGAGRILAHPRIDENTK